MQCPSKLDCNAILCHSFIPIILWLVMYRITKAAKLSKHNGRTLWSRIYPCTVDVRYCLRRKYSNLQFVSNPGSECTSSYILDTTMTKVSVIKSEICKTNDKRVSCLHNNTRNMLNRCNM